MAVARQGKNGSNGSGSLSGLNGDQKKARRAAKEAALVLGMGKDPRKAGRPKGRPSKYRKEAAELARNLALLGCSNDKIAEIMGISDYLMKKWTKEYPDFREAIKKGRDEADTKVAKGLFQRAVGYSHPDMHIAVQRTKGKVTVIKTAVTKHYPPDVTACIFWLANRQREHWRHVAHIEHDGNITYDHKIDLSQLSNEDLNMARRLGLALKSGRVVGQIPERTGG